MSILYSFARDRWGLVAALFSAAMLAAAHGFERFGGLYPCELCLRQREVYWAALLVGLVLTVIFLKPRPAKLLRAGFALLGLVFLTGALIAGYHAGVEWKLWPGPASCTGALADLNQIGTDLLAALEKPSEVPKCDEIPWAMFGLSMAGWNALLSLAFAGFSLTLAWPFATKKVEI